MYLSRPPLFRYADPWELPFDRRFAMLLRGSPRAAYFYTSPDNSTFRYRVYNVAQSLAAEPARRAASASWFTEADLGRMPKVIDSCDVLVIGRNSLYTDRLARLASLARARGRRVLFDVDDLVFDPAHAHLLIDTLGLDKRDEHTWTYWFAYTGRVAATFGLCDGAVVTNAFLAARAAEWSGKPVTIIPNYLNREQQEMSDEVWRLKEAEGWASDGMIDLGYFSGSPSHNRDFAIVVPALARLMEENPSIRLRIAGYLDLPAQLAPFARRVQRIRFQDFVNLQREIGATEVNLVPLQDNTFTNCKSELKWFEAAAVGALTVASPVHAFRRVVDHGRNGWLATSHAWHGILSDIVARLEEHRAAVAPRAREEARERFGWDRQAATITAALFESGRASHVEQDRRLLPQRQLGEREAVHGTAGAIP